MNRIDRLVAIVLQLQSRRLVKAQDIAGKFNLSLRTVYRDIRALEEAGVPVLGEAGVGYRLMDGYQLPPIMFTEDEAAALLTGAKLMQSLSDQLLWKHYEAALDKIKAVLRQSQRKHVEDMNDHIAVVSHPAILHQPPAGVHLPNLLKAIATAQVINLQYTSIDKQKRTNRNVEPVGVYLQNRHWYLVAFCRLRNDYRVFRTDQMDKLILLDETCHKTHPPLQQFITQTVQQRQLEKVIIDVDKDVVKYLGEQKYYNGFIGEEDAGDCVRMTFLCGSLTGFARWLMLFADHATIVEPLALNNSVAGIANGILNKIKNLETLLT